ncbi:MAG: squalene/phytoene synthase family protein [Gammaproteobacteria bacterium]
MNELSLTGSATEFEAYCRSKAVPPGSILHYSLLGQPLAQRRKLLSLYALEREWREIVDSSRDPDVAQSKLAWWRQELRSLEHNEARHPVTQALLPWLRLQDDPHLKRILDSWLDAIEHDLHYGVYSNFTQLSEYCRHIGEAYVVLLVQATGGRVGQNAPFAHSFGVGWVLFERLLAVRPNALHGRQYIPEDELARFQLTFNDLQKNIIHRVCRTCSPRRPSEYAATLRMLNSN